LTHFFSLFEVFVRHQFLITYCAGGKRHWISSIAFFTIHMRHWIRVRRHENNNNSSYKNISNRVSYFAFKNSMRILTSRTFSINPTRPQKHFSFLSRNSIAEESSLYINCI